MPEGSGQPQRYCRQCGAEIRPGTRFCVSCGVSLVPEQSNSGDTRPTSPPPQPAPPGPTGDPIATLKDDSRGSNQGLSDSSPVSGGSTVWEIPSRILYGFKELPLTSKLFIAGTILLLPLTVLTPLGFVIGIIATVACITVLVIRASIGRTWHSSSIVLGVMVLVTLIAGSTSDRIHGTGFSRGDLGSGEGSNESAGGVDPEEPSVAGEQTIGTDEDYSLVAPPLQEAAREWASSSSGSPLFFPNYLPLPADDVEVFVAEGDAGGGYEVWAGDSKVELSSISNASVSPIAGDLAINGEANVDTITMADGHSYYYRVVWFTPEMGSYNVEFMETSVDDNDYYYRLDVFAEDMTEEQFTDMFQSLVRIESPVG